jgi:hypothetical protein
MRAIFAQLRQAGLLGKIKSLSGSGMKKSTIQKKAGSLFSGGITQRTISQTPIKSTGGEMVLNQKRISSLNKRIPEEHAKSVYDVDTHYSDSGMPGPSNTVGHFDPATRTISMRGGSEAYTGVIGYTRSPVHRVSGHQVMKPTQTGAERNASLASAKAYYHEVGHAINPLTGQGKHMHSSTKQWKKATFDEWAVDDIAEAGAVVTKRGKASKTTLNPEDAFSEAYSAYVTTITSRARLRKQRPQSYAYVQDVVEKAGGLKVTTATKKQTEFYNISKKMGVKGKKLEEHSIGGVATRKKFDIKVKEKAEATGAVKPADEVVETAESAAKSGRLEKELAEEVAKEDILKEMSKEKPMWTSFKDLSSSQKKAVAAVASRQIPQATPKSAELPVSVRKITGSTDDISQAALFTELGKTKVGRGLVKKLQSGSSKRLSKGEERTLAVATKRLQGTPPKPETKGLGYKVPEELKPQKVDIKTTFTHKKQYTTTKDLTNSPPGPNWDRSAKGGWVREPPLKQKSGESTTAYNKRLRKYDNEWTKENGLVSDSSKTNISWAEPASATKATIKKSAKKEPKAAPAAPKPAPKMPDTLEGLKKTLKEQNKLVKTQTKRADDATDLAKKNSDRAKQAEVRAETAIKKVEAQAAELAKIKKSGDPIALKQKLKETEAARKEADKAVALAQKRADAAHKSQAAAQTELQKLKDRMKKSQELIEESAGVKAPGSVVDTDAEKAAKKAMDEAEKAAKETTPKTSEKHPLTEEWSKKEKQVLSALLGAGGVAALAAYTHDRWRKRKRRPQNGNAQTPEPVPQTDKEWLAQYEREYGRV